MVRGPATALLMARSTEPRTTDVGYFPDFLSFFFFFLPLVLLAVLPA